MLAEVLYTGGQSVAYAADAATQNTTTSAMAVATGPATTDVWFALQNQLKVEKVGSCGRWDQHQVGRIVAFGMCASTSARMALLPYVVDTKASDATASVAASSLTAVFNDKFQAEKTNKQPDAYALRGALAQHYTQIVSKSRFTSMLPIPFLNQLARNIKRFHTAPYYFVTGDTYSESGSWDWLEKTIQFLLPVADVIAAPFGLGGTVDAIGKGVLGLLGSSTSSPSGAPTPASAAGNAAASAVVKHVRHAGRSMKKAHKQQGKRVKSAEGKKNGGRKGKGGKK